ncbi:MAG: DUF3093 family protein [Propionibacteriales bacterium]|nr:DUF3093 family protein [Propionibacteriales bacterium]
MTASSPESDELPTSTGFRERLSVPVRWWALTALFVGSLWLAFVVSTPPEVSWPSTAILVVAGVALLTSYGSAVVEVDAGVLVAGRARLDWAHCGPAVPLDEEAARRLRGVDADPRAYLLLRPYIRTAVRVDVNDPEDPTPYWMISSRHPGRLAAAINAARRVAD